MRSACMAVRLSDHHKQTVSAQAFSATGHSALSWFRPAEAPGSVKGQPEDPNHPL